MAWSFITAGRRPDYSLKGIPVVRKDTLATRKRIINAAEKLFAEKGVEATSLLDIAKAAKQKNRSALQYHFDNKQGLLDAVLDKHAKAIAERRLAMLDALEAQGEYSLYQVIEAQVVPVAQQMETRDGGKAFVKIHSQLMSSPDYSELRRHRDSEAADVQRMLVMISKKATPVGSDSARSRAILAGCLLVHGLADYTSQESRIPLEIYLPTLIQAIVDLLMQPAPTV
jgi:AcrR family transcriptional regulator